MSVDQTVTSFQFAMLSSLGRVRAGNEDFCAALPEHGIFIVCDGMGGAAAGEIASRLAATTFLERLSTALPLPDAAEPLLDAAVQAANAAVFQQSEQTPRLHGMGTTLVALLLPRQASHDQLGSDPDTSEPHRLWLAHVGDSRCYRLRAGKLLQLTQDHSLVQEQIAAGQITPEQAERSPMRNIITRAIGTTPEVHPTISALAPEPGDLYLLASDGLNRELTDAHLHQHLTADATPDVICQSLIAAANEAGGHDNITVLLLRITGPGL